jgi:hypothetical protein
MNCYFAASQPMPLRGAGLTMNDEVQTTAMPAVVRARTKGVRWIVAVMGAFFLLFLLLLAMPNFVGGGPGPDGACFNHLRQIDGAKQIWADINHPLTNATPTWADIQPYLGRQSGAGMPKCPRHGTYTIGNLQTAPTCSIPGHELK